MNGLENLEEEFGAFSKVEIRWYINGSGHIRIFDSSTESGMRKEINFTRSNMAETIEKILVQYAEYSTDTGEILPQFIDTYEQSPMQEILTSAHELYLRKNYEYGNAVRMTGVVGATVALQGDVAKLRHLVLKTEEPDGDNIRDKLTDILIQAAIGLQMLQEDNWDGITL